MQALGPVVQGSIATAVKVAIRVDASAGMGTGHLRRCLALAGELARFGAEVILVCRSLDNVASSVLAGADFPVLWLPAPNPGELEYVAESAVEPPHAAWARVPWLRDAQETSEALQPCTPDWVVVDHYAFDARWHDQIRKNLVCRIAVIDDLADRALSADFLLDHNWAPDHKVKYADRVAPAHRGSLRILGGPRYALLASGYRIAPRYRFCSDVRSIGIFMGGTDPPAATSQVLAVCREQAGFIGLIEIVSTSANPHLADLMDACARYPNTTLRLDEPSLAAFFARHDLQIGAGGGATWERCCIGVPSIVLTLAKNQLVVASALAGMGALKYARLATNPKTDVADIPGADALADVLRQVIADSGLRYRLAKTASGLVDGRGTERVALCLLGETLHVRRATVTDAPMLHGWRSHPSVRAVSQQTAEIAYRDHKSWMRQVVGDPSRVLLVGQIGGHAVGCIRFDDGDGDTSTVSLYLDPEVQGLGLGARLLLSGEQFMALRAVKTFTVIADVVAGNVASQCLFTACGYEGSLLRYQKRVDPEPDFNSNHNVHYENS